MSFSQVIFLVIVVLAFVNADHPLWINEIEELPDTERAVPRNSDSEYRLPENVIPLEYDIYIDLYFAERTDRPFSYDGRETIIIQALEQNITTIVMHANVDIISLVTLTAENGNVVSLNPIEPFTVEPQFHFLRVNLQESLNAGRNYSLYIEYTKAMNDGPLKRGIWRGWYVDHDGIERIYATTHFQPYNARQAFPCWDEPLFKAVFKLHLSRPTNYSGMYSNTGIESSEDIGNNRRRDNFHATPKMSSYLVTFLVSESFRVIASDISFDPPIRIIGRSNTAGLGNHALELSVGMTKYFDEYFQIPYSTLHPYLLNDHVASPDWASAGTENWGMVSYRELHLIVDPRETIMSVEHYTTTLVSHELAHKWFGNLITCFWWSNTWINEGFASYFGYLAGHEVFPQYDLHEHFNSRYLQASLSFDSGVSTVPMNHEVNTPAQVTGHFGTISYNKGASFLRMVTDMITPETFRKACQYFLLDNFYKATDQYDLFRGFERAVGEDGTLREYANFNFSDFYRIWVNEPGYPLLTVNVNHGSGEIALSQERFSLSPSAVPTEQIYPIPITFATKSNPNVGLKPSFMMTTKEAVLQKNPGEEWVFVNLKQHGHYRVTYDDRTWNLIADVLLDLPTTIDYLNRAQNSTGQRNIGRPYKVRRQPQKASRGTGSCDVQIIRSSLVENEKEEEDIKIYVKASKRLTQLTNLIIGVTSVIIWRIVRPKPELAMLVVDDVFALMRSEKMTYSFGFKILRFLRYENNYHVWNPAISGYTLLRNRLRHLPEAQATFDSFILSYMENVINQLGFVPNPMETVTNTLLRQEILHFACTLRHGTCVDDSSKRFNYMMNDQRYWVDPRIRRHVYGSGVREGGRDAFEFLLNRHISSNIANDQLEILRGLASTRDRDLLTRYLELTLDKTVRHHDKVNAFNYALLGNKENAYTVLQFVKNNIDAIRIEYTEDSPATPVHTALSNLASYLDEEGLVEFEEWLRSTQSNSAQFNSAISAINSARSNMAWGSERADIILAAARDGSATLIVSTALLIIMSMFSFVVS